LGEFEMATLPVQRCEFEGCAKEYQPRREWQKFCSTKCRMEHANGRRATALKLLGQAERAPVALEVVAGVAMHSAPAFAAVGAST
jgi:hypothetical protein